MSRRAWLVPLLLLAPASAWAGTYDTMVLAWSTNGELALVQETAQTRDGGTSLGYRVVGPNVEQKHFVISKELANQVPAQSISPEDCRAVLVELRDLLRLKRFKGVTLNGDACKGDRIGAIAVAADQAQEAEAGELERSSTGDALVRGDWIVRLEPKALTLESPGRSKKLHLPRAIFPSAGHVLLSPTRRLLLILQSVESGDQILVAGFSSKTGEIADFE